MNALRPTDRVLFWPEPVNASQLALKKRLLKAVRDNDADTVRLLCQMGADPDMFLLGGDCSLLARAIKSKNHEAAKALIAMGASPCFPAEKDLQKAQENGPFLGRLQNGSNALEAAIYTAQWSWLEDLCAVAPWESFSSANLVTMALWRRVPESTFFCLVNRLKKEGLDIPGVDATLETLVWTRHASLTRAVALRHRLFSEKDEVAWGETPMVLGQSFIEDRRVRQEWARAIFMALTSDQLAAYNLLTKSKPLFTTEPSMLCLLELWDEAARVWEPQARAILASGIGSKTVLPVVPALWERDREQDWENLVRWTSRAIQGGRVGLLKKFLLPRLEKGCRHLTADERKEVIKENVSDLLRNRLSTSAIANALRETWGREDWTEVLHSWVGGEADKEASEDVWFALVDRHPSGTGGDAGTLDLALCFLEAGVPCRHDKEGKNVLHRLLEKSFAIRRLAGERGGALLRVLVAAGVDPSEVYTPETLGQAYEGQGVKLRILPEAHIKQLNQEAGCDLLAPAQAFLASHRLGLTLEEAPDHKNMSPLSRKMRL